MSGANPADGQEIARLTVVDGGLRVVLTKAFDDPAVWGVALADVARHVARIYDREGGPPEAEALAQIQAMWRSEFESPTDLGSTEVVQ